MPKVDELIQEGRMRRVDGDYGKALELFERAMSVDPTASEPYRYAGQTKSYSAARLPKEAVERRGLLDDAERLILEAERRQRGESPDTLHDRAWIEDERGNFEKAVELYQRARDMVIREGRERKPIFSYNLACALVKAHQPEKAVEALIPVVPELWPQIEKDPDLEALRSDLALRARLEAARKAGGAT